MEMGAGKGQTEEAVAPELEQNGGQDHRAGHGGLEVGFGESEVEGVEGHFDQESEDGHKSPEEGGEGGPLGGGGGEHTKGRVTMKYEEEAEKEGEGGRHGIEQEVGPRLEAFGLGPSAEDEKEGGDQGGFEGDIEGEKIVA